MGLRMAALGEEDLKGEKNGEGIFHDGGFAEILNGSTFDGNFETSEVLNRLKNSEPTDWLGAPPALVNCTKRAAEILFSLTAERFSKAPLSTLHTSRFDVEQIWQQIDLQAHPLLAYVRRKIRNLEKSSDNEFFVGIEPVEKNVLKENGRGGPDGVTRDQEGSNAGEDSVVLPGNDEMDDEEADLDSESEGGGLEDDDEDMDDAEDIDDDEDVDDEGKNGNEKKNSMEDEFFRINEMEKFLDRADADGVFGTAGEDSPPRSNDSEEDGDFDEQDGDFGVEMGGPESEEDEEEKGLGFEKYEDFFGKKRKQKVSEFPTQTLQKEDAGSEGSEEGNSDDETSEDGEKETQVSTHDQPDAKVAQVEQPSSHERRQERLEKRIKQLENANLATKDWTQQGEVTAKKRPMNSALEVELDFEHNVRPPPVITEEVTASLEDMIRARIAEGRFDDVVHRAAASAQSAKERVEIDESKSQKGLGDIYEAEYMQTTGLAAPPTATSEALKEEARGLFRGLCSRLDALSHFHYAPKPVVEDMGVRADVPALAMEEVAPMAVSDASMLAPEEIFAGAEAMQAEGELTHVDRQRRRALKKRKRRGARKAKEAEQMRKRIRPTGAAPIEPKPTPGLKIGHSSYTKSSKVFAALDEAKGDNKRSAPGNGLKNTEGPKQASFLKL